MNEALTGLVVALRPHETGRRRQIVSGALGFAAAGFDLVAHAAPFLEPCRIVADLVGERAADAIDLIDLDAGPWRARQANQQAHRPSIAGREVEKGRIVFFYVWHGYLSIGGNGAKSNILCAAASVAEIGVGEQVVELRHTP